MFSLSFNELPIGTEFSLNGNSWIKRSTRTAYLAEYKRTFYFSKDERVIIDKETAKKIRPDYFTSEHHGITCLPT